ncbi:flavin reductase family protein [Kitasatospora griseola]|uniref:flavin reductase family protein n=1 Tax=Kitasatospora griseola TaxID=2064 RepID=UPI001670692E|nr:flavin reductase family protein [Kitasatospora griseola]GGQ55047.1 hypothetical protein GCM10010195_08310 [Kitasatospora griseola]
MRTGSPQRAGRAPHPGEPDAAGLRQAMGRFPTGVTLLTCGYGDETTAMTLNSLVSVSLDPLLVLVSVNREGRMRPLVSKAGAFAVNLLTDRQRELALAFARPDRPEGGAAVRRTAAVEGVTGNAVLPSALAGVECELHAEVEAGDHVLLIGRVVAIHLGDRGTPPLVFHRGSFTGLAAPADGDAPGPAHRPRQSGADRPLTEEP